MKFLYMNVERPCVISTELEHLAFQQDPTCYMATLLNSKHSSLLTPPKMQLLTTCSLRYRWKDKGPSSKNDTGTHFEGFCKTQKHLRDYEQSSGFTLKFDARNGRSFSSMKTNLCKKVRFFTSGVKQ